MSLREAKRESKYSKRTLSVSKEAQGSLREFKGV